MAVTLRQADEQQAYTLSDDATLWQLESRLREVVLFRDDARLVNSYAVVFPSNSASAAAFADWLIRGGRSGPHGSLPHSQSCGIPRMAARLPIGHPRRPPVWPLR